MPARHFDRSRVRAVRRAADKQQHEVAADVGVRPSTYSGWETGLSVPDQEKLPALARALGRELDDLFRRTGLPNLADLRRDAGLHLNETPRIIGTKSAGPVAGAERGERRLKDRYLAPLAEAYGVGEDELRRAQERSMAEAQKEEGEPEPQGSGAAHAPDALPGTLAEKICLILERSYPGEQEPPSDAEIAEAINDHAGSEVTTEGDIRDFRTGARESAPPIVLEGMATFFGVTPLYFQPEDAVARQVYEGLQLLSASRKGAVGRVRARGIGEQGLSSNVMSFVNDLVNELEEREKEEPGSRQ